MPHIVVAGPLHPSGHAVLDSAPDMTVSYIDEISEESLAAQIADADAVVLRTQTVGQATVDLAPNLKIMSRHGVGYDAVDVEALSARGIALAVCGDVNSTAVAEHAAMFILSASKRLIRADQSVRSGAWDWRNGLEARDIRNRNLLVVGYGRIGQRIASVMSPFEMNIRAYDPFLLKHGWPDGGAQAVESLNDALEWADVISFSMPHTGAPMIAEPEFARMKDGVVIVNTARGGLIDEPAFIAALESGKVAAAGLDVFANEPIAPDHPLTKFDQVIMTPHIAGLTQDSAERMAISSAQNVLDFFNGSLDHSLIVNREQIYG